MKKILFVLLTLALAVPVGFFAAAMAAPVVNEYVHIDSDGVKLLTLGITVLLAIGFLTPKQKGMAFSGINPEFWVKYIMDNLFKDNSFLNLCHKDDEYVVGGSIVHIPQAGAKPTVVKNRTLFPAPMVYRTDADLYFPLDVFRTDPTAIKDAELLEISYDKIDNVLGEHVRTLNEVIAEAMLYHWRAEAAANIIRTTGGAVAAHSSGATGNRKIFLKADLKSAGTRMNKLNIPKSDRYAIIDSDMLSQLQDDADLMKRDVGMELDLKNGIIMRLYGFNLIERSTVLRYDNTGTPIAKDYDAADATTDNAAIICYQKDAVTRALGEVKFFENLNDPTMYADVYSAQVKMGGRKRRTNGEGVVAIVQAAA